MVKLQRAESGMPIMWKLAEDIGIYTILEYADMRIVAGTAGVPVEPSSLN